MPYHPRAVAGLIEDMGDRLVIGSDPFDIELLWRRLYSSGYNQHPDLTTMGVISAFEMACWDIVGKELDRPIYKLLGGQYHEKLRSYTYLYASGDDKNKTHRSVFTDPAAAASRAAAYVAKGFTAVKVDPVEPIMPLAPVQLTLESLRLAKDVVKSIRETVGDRSDILIGTHGQMVSSSAIRLAKRLEKYDPLWFEEPVPPENREEMARIAHATSIPVRS